MFGLPEIVSTAIGAVGGGVGLIGAGVALWKKRQLGVVVKEVFDVVRVYREARKDGEITAEEMDKIINELEEAARAGVAVWKR